MARQEGEVRSGFALRLLSGVAITIPSFAAVYFGFPYFDLIVGLFALALAWEWSAVCTDTRLDPPAGFALILSSLVVVALGSAGFYGLSIIAVAAGAALTYVTARSRGHRHAVLEALGAPYIGLPMAAFVWLRYDMPDGRLTVFWMILAVAATDVGAYIVGRAVGGALLAPRISPKKTWSGLIGGMTAAAIASVVFALVVGKHGPAGAGLLLFAALGAVLGLVSQGGDLLESSAKRYFGVKDMGAIIPGHGGAFDRVDGHLVAAVTVGACGLFLGGEAFSWQ